MDFGFGVCFRPRGREATGAAVKVNGEKPTGVRFAGCVQQTEGIAEPWDRLCPTRQYTAGLYTGGLVRDGRGEGAGPMNRSVRGVHGSFWSFAALSHYERSSRIP